MWMSEVLARLHAVLAAFGASVPTDGVDTRWATDFNDLLDHIGGALGADLAELKLTTNDLCQRQNTACVCHGRLVARLQQALTYLELHLPEAHEQRLAFPPDC
jgi:hypothetical protein